MAVPSSGSKYYVIVPVLLVLFASLLYTGYAFRIRDSTPVQNADVCESTTGECASSSASTTPQVKRAFKPVSLRGGFVKTQPPDDTSDEQDDELNKIKDKKLPSRPWSKLKKIEDLDDEDEVSEDEEKSTLSVENEDDDKESDSDDEIIQIEVEDEENVTLEDDEDEKRKSEEEEKEKRLMREKEEKRKKEEEERRKRMKEEQEKRKKEEERKRKEKELEAKKRKEEEERKRKEKEAAERRKREEAERLLKEEAERRLREEAERRLREEEERRLKEEEEKRLREEEERRLREEEERRKREEERRLKEEEERRKKEEERRRKEEERRKKEEERRKKEEERRLREEEERRKREEERRLKEEEEKRKKEEERRLREEEERRKREEERRLKEEEKRKKEEEDRRLKEEEEERKREEERRLKEEEEERKREEERRLKEEEEKRKKEEERKLKEEEEKRKKEEERKKREKEAAERKKKEEEERKKKELEKKEAERKKKEEEERKKKEEERKRKQAEEDEAERIRDAEEDRKRVERVKKEAEEKRLREEAERRKRSVPKNDDNEDDDETDDDDDEDDSMIKRKIEKVRIADKEKAKTIEALRQKSASKEAKDHTKSKSKTGNGSGTAKSQESKSKSEEKTEDDESKVTKPKVKKRGAKASLSLTELNDMILSMPTFVPNFTAVEDAACQQHGKIFLRQLRGYKLWALQMLDSSAKIPSGLLRGNVNQFGDFDQCLGIQARVKIEEKTVKVQGKYCLASVDFYATHLATKLPVNLMQSRALIRGNMRDPGHFVPKFTTANWALCLPAACSAKDARKSIQDALDNYNMTAGIKFVIDVDPDMCYVKPKSQSYSKETIGVLYFYAIFVCLAIVATLRDYFANLQEKGSYSERIIMAFSLKRTLKALFENKKASPSDIGCIHGIRTLSTIALYMAHKLIPTSRMPYANRVSLTEVAGNPLSSIFRASLFYTDSFLLLSGVLTAFNMAKELNSRSEIRWFSRLIGRFIRLTPSLLAVVFWYAFVMEHTGSGPQWNSAVKANADICKENAWINLFYVQNFFPFEEMCATHTHQLALDMQLSLAAPALVFFLQIKPIIGVIIVFFLLQVSATLRYFATSNNNLSLVIFHGMSMKQLYKTANLTYALPLHRATPYLFGVTLGVLLHYTGKNIQIHKIFNIIGWLLALAFGSWSLFSPWHLAKRDYVYDVEEATHYAVISPLFTAFALCWTIFACHTNNGGIFNRILSNHWMIIFSKLTYTIYLSQFAVFFYNVGTARYTSEFQLYRIIDPYEALVVISVSIVLTLLFDIPMQEVKNIVMEVSDSLPVETKETKEIHAEENHNNIKKISQDLTTEEEEEVEAVTRGWNWNQGKFTKITNPEPSEYEESGAEEYRSSRLKRQDVRRQTITRSEAYDEWDGRGNSRRTSRSEEHSMDEGRTGRNNYRYSDAGLEDDETYLPPRDRYYSGSYTRSPMRDFDAPMHRRSVSRERIIPKEPEISRDYSKKPLITISKEDDYQRSPRSSMPRFSDQQRSLSSESEFDLHNRRNSYNRRSAEPRIIDDDDWEDDLRIRRNRLLQERLSSQERDRVPPPVVEEQVDEWDTLRRRSSAEGKLALLKEPIRPGNMELWTVSKLQLGSSQEPEDEDEELYLQQRREYREQGPPLREEFEDEEEEMKQRNSFASESLPTSFEEEDDATNFDFALKNSKSITVQDLSKLPSEDEPFIDKNRLDVKSGLFKRESIIKSQASEEDPEYLLPERPKLVEQEQEHPFKKAWQMQKSRSEEEGPAGFIVKEPKTTLILEKQKEEPEETKNDDEADRNDSGAQAEDFGEPDVSCDVTFVWQARSNDTEDTKTSNSKSETSSTSSRYRWLDDDDLENIKNKIKSEEENWSWTEKET